MNPTASRIAVLMGTPSLATIATAISAHAQNQQVAQAQTAQAGTEEIPETVLITGSLIRGTAAVGAPVTNLGLKDLQTTGAIKTADLFRTIPAANVSPTGDGTNSGGHLEREQRVNLRGLDATFPPQADGICSIDPSIIPALALDHIGINFVIRNITGRHPAFEYGPSNSGRSFAAYDILKSDDGRTFNLIVTKTW